MARRFFALLAVIASLVAAGCGGGSEVAQLSADKLAAVKSPLRAGTAVTPTDAAELLLNAAESAFPTLFPGHQPTQSYGPFKLRFYAATNTYIGVTVTADAAYQLYAVYTVGPA